FLEEADILNRNDCLIGEGLQQLDLVVSERPSLGARHRDNADGSAFPQHGYPEAASNADRVGQCLILVLRININIRHVDNRALEDRPPCSEGPRWTRREYAIRCLEGFGSVVVLGDTVEQLAV